MARKFKVGDVAESLVNAARDFKRGHRGIIDHLTAFKTFPYFVKRRRGTGSSVFAARELKLVRRAK